jgi:hypothetical protein
MCVQVQQRVLQYVQRQWSALKLVDAVKTALSRMPFVDTGWGFSILCCTLTG